jgi:phosphoribosylanthranilate isomerase
MVIKICGLTRSGDAIAAARAGADWLGLNFWPRSKRFIDPIRACDVAARVREAGVATTLIGVFVNQPAGDILRIAEHVGLDGVQLHGDETAADCAALMAAGVTVIKALALGSRADIVRLAGYPGEVILVDTPAAGYGGSGRCLDWSLARAAVEAGERAGKRVILAGGLDPDNVARAVAMVKPSGVDVASGVESAPGVKDPDRVRAFVAAATGKTSPGREEKP